jgi:hypothetical protein
MPPNHLTISKVTSIVVSDNYPNSMRSVVRSGGFFGSQFTYKCPWVKNMNKYWLPPSKVLLQRRRIGTKVVRPSGRHGASVDVRKTEPIKRQRYYRHYERATAQQTSCGSEKK